MNSSFNNSINITVMQMQRKNAEADELWSTEHITMLACVFFIPIITISIVIAICKTIEYRRKGSESQQSGKKKRRHSKKKKKKKKKNTTSKRKSERYVNTDGSKRSSIIERYEQELKTKNKDSTKVEFDYSIPSSYPF